MSTRNQEPSRPSSLHMVHATRTFKPRSPASLTQHFLKVAFAIIVDPDELEGAAEIRRVAVGHKVSQSLSANRRYMQPDSDSVLSK